MTESLEPTETTKSFPILSLRGLGAFLLGSLLMFGVGKALEATFHTAIAETGYVSAQRWLSNWIERDKLRVSVVDISGIPRVRDSLDPSNPEDLASLRWIKDSPDRSALRALIRAIAEQSPSAIVVDGDHSDPEHDYVTNADPEMFEEWLALTRGGVPIIAGVADFDVPPSRWLGAEEYRELAGAIVGYRDLDLFQPVEITIQPSDGQAPYSIPSIGLAASGKVLKKGLEPRPPVGWFFDTTETVERAGLVSGFRVTERRMLIDFTLLDPVMDRTLATWRPESIADSARLPDGSLRFTGKVVFLGYAVAGEVTDMAWIPGFRRQVPGVFVHALSAQTMLSSPLMMPNYWFRLILDALVLLLAWYAIGLLERYVSRQSMVLNHKRADQVVAVIVAAAILAISLLAVTRYRILWMDFVFVAAFTMVEPQMRVKMSNCFEWVRATLLRHVGTTR